MLGQAGVPKPRGGAGPSSASHVRPVSCVSLHPTGLTEPMLIRLDVESKLSEQLKVRGAGGGSRRALCPPPPASHPVAAPGSRGGDRRGEGVWCGDAEGLSSALPLQLAFFHTRGDDKPAVLLHLLRSVVKPQDQTVVFVATKHHTEYLKEASGIWGCPACTPVKGQAAGGA